MQSSFMGSLMELSEIHDDIMYLTADSGEGGLDLMYKKNFPNRCYNFGIAEENMVAAAAGMALCGKIPFVYTAAPFLAYRSYEFIRDDLCLQNVPVKLFGSGSGISVSSLGPTHHTTEDIAILRCIPNITILSPSTPKQAAESVKIAYETKGPVYVRLGMNKEKEYFGENYCVPKSGVDILCDGSKVGIITTGAILGEVMDAADILKEHGMDLGVGNVFSIKPFNEEEFLKFISKFEYLFSVEEHNVIGGLGEMAADIIVRHRLKINMIKIGLYDRFTKGYGTLDTVRKENGLDAESIAKKVQEVLGEGI